MVWNIGFQLSGLLLTLVLLFFVYSQTRLKFRAEKAFIAVVLNVLLCNVFDILAVVAMNYKSVVGDWACEVICEFLLLTIVSVACHASWFATDEVDARFSRRWRIASVLPIIVLLAVCIFYKTYQYDNPETGEIHFYGIPDSVAFIFCMLYVLAGALVAFHRRKALKQRQKIIICSWLLIWSVAGLLQRFFPFIPVVGFSTSLACLIMYTKLENPHENIDSVYEIFNHKAFKIKIEEIINKSSSESLVNISITNMDVITEIFGSKILYKLMKNICEYVQSFPNSLAFKLEDNVFSILVDNRDDMDYVLEKVVDRFDKHWEIDGTKINVNANVSIIERMHIFKDYESVEEAIHYYALLEGDNNDNVISIDYSEVEKRRQEIETKHALDWALKNNGVEVFYQPVYNIDKGRFTAMEALVRIRDEDGTLIFPNDFIEYAEKNGMILKLGEEIFRGVCDFIRRNRIEQYGIEFIDVNLSVVQCMQEDLASSFKDIMGEYQVSPHMINLEITETSAIASKKTLDRNMEELIDYGVSFSLDDYGSGYTNLTYIVELPVNIIKIDREITINYRKSEKAKIAADSTINMIHNLGMEIIVEGVENEEQYRDFKNLGVNLIQGYYFSKPLPRNEIIQFIQKWL